jgi:uncharacterized protein (TIGR03382 family)
MHTKTRWAAAAVALAAASSPAWALQPPNNDPGNGSVVFVALDSIGTPTSIFVDLGYLFSAFDPIGAAPVTVDAGGSANVPSGIAGALLAPGTVAQWNFAANSLTVNGAAVSGDFRWGTEFAIFNNAALATETQWAVLSGVSNFFPAYYLSTGNPATQQVSNQLAGSTSNMSLVLPLYSGQLNQGSFGSAYTSAFAGANAVVAETSLASGYVGLVGNGFMGPGGNGNWGGNLAWNALLPTGATSAVRVLDDLADGADGVTLLPGTFSYANGVLTWETTPIPEPGAIAMALAGLAVLVLRHRRPRKPAPLNRGGWGS